METAILSTMMWTTWAFFPASSSRGSNICHSLHQVVNEDNEDMEYRVRQVVVIKVELTYTGPEIILCNRFGEFCYCCS